jgi:hypothetical protein
VPEQYRGKPARIGLVIRTDRGGPSPDSIIEIVEAPRPPVVVKPGVAPPAAPASAAASTPQPAASPIVTKAAAPTPTPGACLAGFVWREAAPSDHVCVPPERRSVAARQQAEAAAHRSPGGGPYGADSCRAGFVWRDAFANDHVCVTPQERAQAADENRLGPTRMVR